MKKLYTIICASALTLFSINANATIHNVSVGIDSLGAQGDHFVPYVVTNVHVGDTVKFIDLSTSMQHNVTGISLPAGAATMSSGTLTATFQTYSYHVTVAGSYTYHCSFHAGMNGSFNAIGSGAGITDPTQNLVTSAYPNPFTSSLAFKYNGVDKISVFNVLGDVVKSVETGGNFGTVEMNFEGMASGIYFYRTYKDGLVFETRKIVKK